MRRQEEEERYRRRDEARRRQEDGDIERLRQEQDRMAEQERLDRLRRANIPRQLRHQPTVQGESLDARADRFIRDAIGTETLRHMHQSTGQGSKGRSASSGAAHRSSIATANFSRSAGKADISSAQPKSEGASPKSGSPINIRDDVTPEDTSTSLSKISKHAHGPGERSFPLEKPVEEIQDHTYEQWIVDGILRDDSGERKYCSDSPSPTTPPTRIKRAKRIFTPEERAVIRQKIKTGVCKDCRRAKRRVCESL